MSRLQSPSNNDQEFSLEFQKELGKFAYAIASQKWLILAIMLSGLIGALIFHQSQGPAVYETNIKVQISTSDAYSGLNLPFDMDKLKKSSQDDGNLYIEGASDFEIAPLNYELIGLSTSVVEAANTKFLTDKPIQSAAPTLSSEYAGHVNLLRVSAVSSNRLDNQLMLGHWMDSFTTAVNDAFNLLSAKRLEYLQGEHDTAKAVVAERKVKLDSLSTAIIENEASHSSLILNLKMSFPNFINVRLYDSRGYVENADNWPFYLQGRASVPMNQSAADSNAKVSEVMDAWSKIEPRLSKLRIEGLMLERAFTQAQSRYENSQIALYDWQDKLKLKPATPQIYRLDLSQGNIVSKPITMPIAIFFGLLLGFLIGCAATLMRYWYSNIVSSIPKK